jgi:hypothetical protein
MKKFTLFFLLCFCAFGTFAQWNSSTSPAGIHYTAGNVGVGTTSPQYKLHLWSTDLNPVFYIDANDAYLSFTRHFLDLKSKSTFNQVPYISWTAPSGQRQAFLGWRTDCFGLTLENGYNFAINGGNVGIGTTSPDAKLAVKGTIHTQEVKVDLQGAVAPDYVFEKDYNLRPLPEVESYINMNKHLPEIPSARQMEEEGLHLKEMNLLLLKKVEELTLYVIELKKENEQQQKAIEALSKK